MRTTKRILTVTYVLAGFLSAQMPAARAAQAAKDARVERLFSSDPAVRGAAKTELLQHPDPALLPALLAALPTSQGSNRDDLIEVLDKYDDPRKIPAFLAYINSPAGKEGNVTLDQQLAHLGAPAAEALLASCAGRDEDYGRWVGGIFSWMHQTGAHYAIQAVQMDGQCEHSAGVEALHYMFGDADPDAVSRADIQLAADAAIDPDNEKIRYATRKWLSSLDDKAEIMDFSGIVDVLIAVYQSNVPAETRVRIATMLSDHERPRVTRFMRAATHAPNPDIQNIASQYLTRYPPKTEAPAVRTSANARTPQQKIKYLNQLRDSPPEGDADLNAKILPFVKDSNAEVRAAAVSALGGLNAPSNDVRQERPGDPATALPAIEEASKDPSPAVRAAAVEALGEMRDFDDVALIVGALKDSDAAVVNAALAALQQVPNDAAVPALTAIYRDEKNSADVRNQAASTLETICSPDSIPIFLENLHLPGGQLSLPAAMALNGALKKSPNKSAFEPIRKALEEPGQAFITRDFLVVALAETKDPQAFGVLADLLKAPVLISVPKIADALGVLDDPRAIPLLMGLLKHEDGNVRISASYALSHSSNFSASPELIAALKDPDTTVQMWVANALVSSHDPRGIDALIAAIPNRSAIGALGDSKDPRAVPPLLAFFQNPANKTQERGLAAASLAKLGDARAIEPLIASLKEDNGGITIAASFALMQFKDKRAIEPLKEAYARWDTGQRDNAMSVKEIIAQALAELNGPGPIVRTTGSPN